MIICHVCLWDASWFCRSKSDTDLVFRQVQFLHVALLRFAFGELPQFLRRPLKQLAPYHFVGAPVCQVVRREAAIVHAVDVGTEVEEAANQRGVLEIHSQVEGRSSTALFLPKTMKQK